ncbi:MAG: DNA translocase FtsK 4TM domain-containing protein [bacterium]
MSRKRKPGRPKGSANKNKAPESTSSINPDTIRDIVAIVLFIIAFILLVSFFGFGGSLGRALNDNLRIALGWTTFVLPIILGVFGYALLRTEFDYINKVTYAGLILFLSSLSGLFHIFYNPLTAIDVAKAGNGGGLLGFYVQKLMLVILNAPVSFVILLALAIVGVLLSTNTSLRSLLRRDREDEKPTLKNDIKIHETNPVKNALVGFKKPEPNKAETPTMTVGDTSGWTFPSNDLLEEMTTRADSGNVRENAATIQKTLADFAIDVAMNDVNVGPTVTQYTLKPNDGVKLEKITGLDKNLALSLAAHPIRIEAPIPGKSLVGIEVPNKKGQIVRMRNIIESETFKNRKSQLSVILGLDVAGHPQIADITKMPHLLIAGSTGSGKSVCINALLTSLLYQNSPSQLKMVLVDPKRVELSLYNDLPHLLTPVIVEQDKTVSALKWAVAEMEHRYRVLQQAGKRNISDYNAAKGTEALPYIVIVIDELADLMAVSSNEVEGLICRLAQMARAVGIHLIVATQRPSVDVITGLIKANITTRIAFAVASNADSRTILDQGGAEKLLGNGDMLFVSAEISKPRRIQGAFVSEKEARSVTDFIKTQGKPEYNEEILLQNAQSSSGSGMYGPVDDDLFTEAAECVIRTGKASASLLQRRLRIGYARAARLLDILEERGVVGPADGARPRDVLVEDVDDIITETEYEEE